MIVLTVDRPVGGQIKKVTARYDDEHGYWLCEDRDFYEVLKSYRLPPMQYYPDPALDLVNMIARWYHGEVTDLRPARPDKSTPGVAY